MGAYASVQAWIGECRDGDFFPPLDGEGGSSLILGRETEVFLVALPKPPDGSGDPVYLYMPLCSLAGADDAIRLEIFRAAAEGNMVGALPTGYRLFHERERNLLYLGGQFSPVGLDAAGFRSLVDDFMGYGRLESRKWLERLAECARGAATERTDPSARNAVNDFDSRRTAGLLRV